MPVDFTLVNRYAALRDQSEPQPAPIAPTVPQAPVLQPVVSGGMAAPRGVTAPPPRGGPLKLVSFGGYQMDQSVLPYAQQLANQYGLRVSSGYRDPKHNARIGGVKNSYHLSGRAIDFVGSAKQMQAAQARARALGAREALIHSVHGGPHLHVAW